MKSFKLLLSLAALTALTVSCESDKAEMNYVQKNNLVGTWKVAQIGTTNQANGIDYVPYQGDAVCGTDIDKIMFNEDMTYMNHDFHEDTTGLTCQEDMVEGTYAQDNHNLTLTTVDDAGQSHSTTVLITKLTYTNLEVNYTDDSGHLVFMEFVKE
ncbi:lipocalin family protein [Flavobacterium sp. XGLA_31]|uniref:lipocalin family protein n=1 Tax=Flavobacterium sp. XGLA_31 TaxID=3447666 RepID=UPI003F318522